jgi:proteasome beta subunit
MNDIQQHITSTGTTTLALICKDGVLLAADRRVTRGHEVVSREFKKIYPIGKNILATWAGNVSDIQRITKVISAEVRLMELKLRRSTKVREVASLLNAMVYGNIRNPSVFFPITAFVVGGYDSEGPHVFNISPDGTIVEVDTFVSTGSGSTFAISVLEDSYRKDINVKEGIDLVKRALNVALLRDSASGNGYHIYSVTKEGTKLEAEELINTGIKA